MEDSEVKCIYRKRSSRHRQRKTCADSKAKKPMIIKRKLLTSLLIIVIVFILVTVWINSSILPAMLALSEARVRSIATNAMLDAIVSSLSADDSYAKLLKYLENGQKIYMLQADTIAMNRLAARCTEEAQKKLSQLGDIGISIAMGTITGIPLLSGVGPKIRMTFTPAGSVAYNFTSSLTTSGINQSLYRVNIVLTAKVYIILPGASKSVEVSSQAAIAESVIVGEVPQVYTNVPDIDSMLNLVPNEVQP